MAGMSSCEEAAVMITALVDGELELADVERVQAHLDMCDDCAARREMEARLKDFLVDRLVRVDMPEGLRARVRAQLTDIDPDTSDDPPVPPAPPAGPGKKKEGRSLRHAKWPLFLVLSVMMLMGVVLMIVEGANVANQPGDNLPFDIGGVHRAATGAGVLKIRSHEREELSSWLIARLGAYVQVPDLAALGLTPAGARILNFRGDEMGMVLYRDYREDGVDLPPVVLIMAPPDTAMPKSWLEPRTVNGLTLGQDRFMGKVGIAWFTSHGAAWFIATRRDEAATWQAAEAVLNALESPPAASNS